jgi:hypothetical protein
MENYKSNSNSSLLIRRSRSLPKSKFSSLLINDVKLIDATLRPLTKETSRNYLETTETVTRKQHSETRTIRDSIKPAKCTDLRRIDHDSTQGHMNNDSKSRCDNMNKCSGRIPSPQIPTIDVESISELRKMQYKGSTIPLNILDAGKISHMGVRKRIDEFVRNDCSLREKSASEFPSKISYSLSKNSSDIKDSHRHKKDRLSRINYLQLRFERDEAIVEYITGSPLTTTKCLGKKISSKITRSKEKFDKKDEKRHRAVSIVNSAA